MHHNDNGQDRQAPYPATLAERAAWWAGHEAGFERGVWACTAMHGQPSATEVEAAAVWQRFERETRAEAVARYGKAWADLAGDAA